MATTGGERATAAQLQTATTQAVLSIARRDHRDEQVGRLVNLIWVCFSGRSELSDFDRFRAALEAGVQAADRELSAGPTTGGRG
jgi:hypothetical protein